MVLQFIYGSIFAVRYCWYNVPESMPKRDAGSKKRSPINWGPIGLLCVASVCYFFGFLNLFTVYPLFLKDRFDLGPIAFIGFLFINGVCSAISSIYGLTYFLHTREWSTQKLMVVSTVLNGIAQICLGFLATQDLWVMVLHFAIIFAQCFIFTLYYSSLMILGAFYASSDNKAETLGTLSASIFVSYIIAPNVCINVYSVLYWGSFLVAGILSFIGTLCLIYLMKEYPLDQKIDKSTLKRMSVRMSGVGMEALQVDVNAIVDADDDDDEEDTDSVMDDLELERRVSSYRGEGTSV